jgi:hypothetical protein
MLLITLYLIEFGFTQNALPLQFQLARDLTELGFHVESIELFLYISFIEEGEATIQAQL